MSDLRIDVDFAGKGSDKIIQQINGLVTPLSKASVEYDKLVKKMWQFEDAGKKNSLQYELMAKKQRTLITEINNLDKGLTATGKSTSIFREKNINLGADLTILAFGVRSIAGDIRDMSTELQKGSVDVGKLTGLVATATIQLLAMTPALKAIGAALPAAFSGFLLVGSKVVGIIAAIVAQAVLAKGASDALSKSILEGANFWDAYAESVRHSTLGLIDFTNNAEKVIARTTEMANKLFIFGKDRENLLKQTQLLSQNEEFDLGLSDEENKIRVDNLMKMDDEEEKSHQDRVGREMEYRQELAKTDKTKKGTKEKEKDAIDELIADMKLQLDLAKTFRTLDSDLLVDLNAQIEAQLEITSKMEDRLKLGQFLNQIDAEGNDLIKKRLELIKKQVGTWTVPAATADIGNAKSATLDETAALMKEISEQIEQNITSAFSQALSLSKQIESLLGEGAGAFLQAFEQMYSIMQSIIALIRTINLLSSLFSFIPGGGAIASIATAAAGMSATNTGGDSGFNGTIIIESEVEQTKGVRFLRNTMPEYNYREGRKN